LDVGVILSLRLIDHERIAVQGLAAVNEAIRSNNPAVLREYLQTLPIEVNDKRVSFHQQRQTKLTELKAPDVILQNEARFVDWATGAAYQPAMYATATLEELRQLLGTWCWLANTHDLDKTWRQVEWFLEPAAGLDEMPTLAHADRNSADPTLSLVGQSLYGAASYPLDIEGKALIRTLGTPECSGYNPPAVAAEILQALNKIDTDHWDQHLAFRTELHQRENPNDSQHELREYAETELVYAKDGFAVLRNVYARAASLGYGVSCEFSV
jgi:hypothetical protein